jgi:ribosome maturation factor RimP
MTHPLIPQIMELAIPIAQELGLEVVGIVFQTNKRPPVLRVDIRDRETDISLEDCERMSLALGEKLEERETIATAYILEVSSPGVSKELISDRDFISFKGFSVVATTSTPEQNRTEWRGRLQVEMQMRFISTKKEKQLLYPVARLSKLNWKTTAN